MTHTPTIRVATLADAKALLEIYAYYVTDTAISFEYEVPTVTEFERRIANILEKYPYLVAELDGRIVGYAYAGPFHSRPAYQWNVETTIYIQKDCRQMGIGKILYEELERVLKLQNVLKMNACIAVPEEEDEYLTQASIKFHEAVGFNMVGKFADSGYKFGRWYGIAWMDKYIGEHVSAPSAVIPLKELENYAQ